MEIRIVDNQNLVGLFPGVRQPINQSKNTSCYPILGENICRQPKQNPEENSLSVGATYSEKHGNRKPDKQTWNTEDIEHRVKKRLGF